MATERTGKNGEACRVFEFQATAVHMPAVPRSVYGQQRPSCMERIKTGFKIGFCVGLSGGVIFGSLAAFRYGLRGREFITNVGKIMLQSGGTMGGFVAIGTGLRC